jgi:hypothetical protein
VCNPNPLAVSASAYKASAAPPGATIANPTPADGWVIEAQQVFWAALS